MLRFLVLACAFSAINAYFIPTATVCGIPAIEPTEMSANIVGGEDAKANSWPWMTEVIKNGGHYCGATLISERWIVSAAHCFERNPKLSSYQFSVGGHVEADLSERNRQTFTAKRIIRHEDYNARTSSNDIALIEIDGAVFNDYVSPACLATSRPNDGTMAYVTGWGNQETLIRDRDLQQVNVPIVNQGVCNAAYGGDVDETMICAGYSAGGKDSCQGDSGGPLVVKVGNQWTLAGVVSWGYGCAEPNKYGVYSDVSHLYDWIQANMN